VPRDRFHVHGLEPPADAQVADLVRLDDAIACSGLDAELEQLVENLGVHLGWGLFPRGHVPLGKMGWILGTVRCNPPQGIVS
jgi:hypothetical protein